MEQPHDNWATYYDFVYEKTFGSLYSNLTFETLKAINQILVNGTILDLGAGTGRLAIPMSEQGYDVIAVEKSMRMVNEFQRKLVGHNHRIKIHSCSISEYENGNAELAIALFTVLSYSVTEDELSKNIQNICKHINPQGYFFFDLPNTVFFSAGRLTDIQSNTFTRFVELTSSSKIDTYIYKEKCSGIFKGKEFSYEDAFIIRYWSISTIDKMLKEFGFNDTSKTFPQFNLTGSTYKLYQRK